MKKKITAKTTIYIITSVILLSIIVTIIYKKTHNSAAIAYTTSTEYAESINYSCKKSSDCEIKDVHNCCGEYSQCVNKKAKVDPAFIEEACRKERIGSICGAAAINQCECVNNRCAGVQNK